MTSNFHCVKQRLALVVLSRNIHFWWCVCALCATICNHCKRQLRLWQTLTVRTWTISSPSSRRTRRSRWKFGCDLKRPSQRCRRGRQRKAEQRNVMDSLCLTDQVATSSCSISLSRWECNCRSLRRHRLSYARVPVSSACLCRPYVLYPALSLALLEKTESPRETTHPLSQRLEEGQLEGRSLGMGCTS